MSFWCVLLFSIKLFGIFLILFDYSFSFCVILRAIEQTVFTCDASAAPLGLGSLRGVEVPDGDGVPENKTAGC